jgi:hypothetical protein
LISGVSTSLNFSMSGCQMKLLDSVTITLLPADVLISYSSVSRVVPSHCGHLSHWHSVLSSSGNVNIVLYVEKFH